MNQGKVNMSELAKDESATPDHARPKGEYKMLLVLLALCVALFADSLRSDGFFQGNSAGREASRNSSARRPF
jgi:hypothetical protein